MVAESKCPVEVRKQPVEETRLDPAEGVPPLVPENANVNCAPPVKFDQPAKGVTKTLRLDPFVELGRRLEVLRLELVRERAL